MSKETSEARSAWRGSLQDAVTTLEGCIRRRLLGKMRALQSDSYDIDDVIASTRRRLDVACTSGRLTPAGGNLLDAFIWKTAMNVACEAARRRDRQRALVDMMRWLTHEEQQVADELDFELLRQVIDDLEADDQRVLELWSRGMTHEEVANVVGIPMSTYRSRWRRLLDHLRTVLRQCTRENESAG